jgi:hypothetical protein
MSSNWFVINDDVACWRIATCTVAVELRNIGE